MASPQYTCTNSAPLVLCTYFLLLNHAKSNLDNVLTEFSAILYCDRYIMESSMETRKFLVYSVKVGKILKITNPPDPYTQTNVVCQHFNGLLLAL